MKRIYHILFVLMLIILQLPSYSQVAIEEQSAFLDSVLVDLQNSSDPMSAVEILDQQLNIKNALIDKIKFQIVQIDKDISNNEIYYKNLNSQLDYEKKMYSDLILRAHRLNSLVHDKFDVFSLDNLYTTYRQFLYMKWMADYRKKKIYRINSIKSEIATVVQELDSNKRVKSVLAEKIGVERSFIKQYTDSKSSIIKEMKMQAKADASKFKKTNLDSIKNSSVASNIDENDTTALFQVQKGYLIWPVQKSVIINYYGEKPHPVYENVTIKNDGLDFCVPSDSEVQCVFQGVVTKISKLPTDKYVVIVRHGSFYTVYNGLDDLDVDEGDELDKGDEIGEFETDESHSVFNFQIWKGSETLDPYKWLAKTTK